MDPSNLEYQLSKTHINNRFKSFQLDLLDNNYDSDEQTINFDDEYSEISTFNKLKNQKKNKNYEIRQKHYIINNNQQNYLEITDYNNQTRKSKNYNNSSEKKRIDRSLKDLMQIEPNSTNNKQSIINILMDNELIQKKEIDENEIIKEKNKNKYYYIKSKSKSNIYSKPRNTYGRNGYYLELEQGNPEYIKDINYAKYKLKNKIEQENELIASLLYNGSGPLTNPHKSISRKDIDKKIKNALDKKYKNLQKIERKLYEQERLEHTFTPCMSFNKKIGNKSKSKSKSKRSLDIFLKDQEQFQKKVKLKTQNLLLKSQSEKKVLYKEHPTINKNSQEIVKKLDVPKNVYVRLYKRSTYERKKNYDKNLLINNNIIKTKSNSKNKNHTKKYSNIQSKINIWKEKYVINDKEKNQQNNKINNRNDKYNKSFTRKAKSSTDSFIDKKIFNFNDLATNRMLYNKFNENYKKYVEKIILEKNNFRYNDDLELDENQYNEILYNFGMVNSNIKNTNNIKDQNKKEKNKSNNKIINTNNKKYEINSFSAKEKILAKKLFELLKLDKDKIKISNLKQFLIFVLSLHNYHFYHKYKTSHNSIEIQKLFPLDKYKKEDLPLIMIKKYNDELILLIDKDNKKNTKYFYINKKSGKIIITLENYVHIKNDFSLFNINYLSKKQNTKNILELNNNNLFDKKEEFNALTYRKLKNKSMTNNPLANIDHKNRILIYEKRKIDKQEKLFNELYTQKIKECTFKPKINTTFPFCKKYDSINKNKNEKTYEKYNKFINKKDKKLKRFDEMHEEGKRTLKLKRNRTREEMEYEDKAHECTFHPEIRTLPDQMIKKNTLNDIYNDKNNKDLYERIKRARLEKMVKDSNNDRYDLSDELKRFVKDKKEYNIINIDNYFNKSEINYYNIINNDSIENEQDNMLENGIICEDFKQTDKNDYKNDIENSNGKYNDKENGKGKEEKIPLLIIDIIIREGLRKNIFVFEGDTPRSLAQKFSKENNLDIETQRRLEESLHNYLKKLLTNIEEEN